MLPKAALKYTNYKHLKIHYEKDHGMFRIIKIFLKTHLELYSQMILIQKMKLMKKTGKKVKWFFQVILTQKLQKKFNLKILKIGFQENILSCWKAKINLVKK